MPDLNTSPASDRTSLNPSEGHSTPDDGAPGANASADDSPTSETGNSGRADPSLGDTAGTGTVIALGCIGGTLFLIVLGLLYLGITQLFG